VRLKQLQRQLKKQGCIVEDPLDLFYLTGLTLTRGQLLVSAKDSLLLVDKRYIERAQEQQEIAVALEGKGTVFKIKEWLFDPRTISYARFLDLNKKFTLIPRAPLFEELRSIKEDSEILKLKKSARLLWKGFLLLKRSLRVGISEEELSRRFSLFCLEQGAEGPSFEPIIAFGKNSAQPHHRAGPTRLKKGDVVLIDIGVCLNCYHSDLTRTLFFQGEDPELARLSKIVKKAYKNALSLCRPGTAVSALDAAVRTTFCEEGVEPLFLHALGHGIGLAVHEFPLIKGGQEAILQEGMVINIEPGLYLRGRGGIRHEDTLIITTTGYSDIAS
jgi:Xaa-Pro aminopeptidase